MSVRQFASLWQRWREVLPWLGVSFIGLALGWLVLRQPTFGFLLTGSLIVILVIIILFFERNGVFSLRRVVPMLLIITILSPYIRLPGDIPDVRPEFLIVLVASGLLFLGCLAKGTPIRLRHFPVYKWFGLFAFLIFLTMAYAATFKAQPISGRDFWELVKVILYFLIFALVVNQKLTPTSLERYYKLVLLVFIISAFFGFLQYFDFANINELVSPYYAPTQMKSLLSGRITGTTGNPNEFGALMVLATSLALSGLLFLKEKRKLRLLCLDSFPVFALALVLTLSRSSLISLLIAVATILFLFLQQKGLRPRVKRLLNFVLLSCIIGACILQILPEKAFYRYGQIATFTQAESWRGRVENWKTHFAIWLESPWFGWGPGKATMGTIVDNEWLLLLRRYGIVGLVVFLCFFGSLFFGLSRIRKAHSDPLVVALTVALQGTFVGYAFYMFLAAVYHSMQLMSIFILLLGLAYSQYEPRKIA
jgi:O-antigen ligase